jgi:transcription initiation factor TFIIIB Brf1 subunit/transcription initiation factor TFIIB
MSVIKLDVSHALEVNISNEKLDEENEWDFLFEEVIAVDSRVDHVKLVSDIRMDVLENTIIPVEIEKELSIVDYRLCPDCNILCNKTESAIICTNCGLTRECQENRDFNKESYNHSANSYVAFTVIGNSSYGLKRSYLRTCSNYNVFRNNNNKKEFENIVFQYEGSKPPHNIITYAADLFDQIINAGHVYRKNGKRGVMGACLYESCRKNNLSRTVKDISKIMNTEEKYISQGIRILQELNELKVISVTTSYEPLDDYLGRYFPVLGIPNKYHEFVTDIIYRADIKHVHVNHDCRITTKCVGAIYLLTRRIKSLRYIKKETISTKCDNISKSTFVKYYNLLYDNPRIIKKCFKKHGIPMPSEWRGI